MTEPPKDFSEECWKDLIEDATPSDAMAYLITAGFLAFCALALYGLGALLGVAK